MDRNLRGVPGVAGTSETGLSTARLRGALTAASPDFGGLGVVGLRAMTLYS